MRRRKGRGGRPHATTSRAPNPSILAALEAQRERHRQVSTEETKEDTPPPPPPPPAPAARLGSLVYDPSTNRYKRNLGPDDDPSLRISPPSPPPVKRKRSTELCGRGGIIDLLNGRSTLGFRPWEARRQYLAATMRTFSLAPVSRPLGVGRGAEPTAMGCLDDGHIVAAAGATVKMIHKQDTNACQTFRAASTVVDIKFPCFHNSLYFGFAMLGGAELPGSVELHRVTGRQPVSCEITHRLRLDRGSAWCMAFDGADGSRNAARAGALSSHSSVVAVGTSGEVGDVVADLNRIESESRGPFEGGGGCREHRRLRRTGTDTLCMSFVGGQTNILMTGSRDGVVREYDLREKGPGGGSKNDGDHGRRGFARLPSSVSHLKPLRDGRRVVVSDLAGHIGILDRRGGRGGPRLGDSRGRGASGAGGAGRTRLDGHNGNPGSKRRTGQRSRWLARPNGPQQKHRRRRQQRQVQPRGSAPSAKTRKWAEGSAAVNGLVWAFHGLPGEEGSGVGRSCDPLRRLALGVDPSEQVIAAGGDDGYLRLWSASGSGAAGPVIVDQEVGTCTGMGWIAHAPAGEKGEEEEEDDEEEEETKHYRDGLYADRLGVSSELWVASSMGVLCGKAFCRRRGTEVFR